MPNCPYDGLTNNRIIAIEGFFVIPRDFRARCLTAPTIGFTNNRIIAIEGFFVIPRYFRARCLTAPTGFLFPSPDWVNQFSPGCMT